MEIIPKKSPCILIIVLILHLLSCWAVIQTSLPWYVQIIFLIFVGAHGVRPWIFPAQKIVKCHLNNNQWFLQNAKGETHQTALLGSTFVSLPLIILNFPRHSILLSADVMDKDLLRKLRVMLLFCPESR
jgi:hypothetical protein